jgi:hypothetical protein
VPRVAPNAIPVVASLQVKMRDDTPQESPIISKAGLLGDVLGSYTDLSTQSRDQ